MTLMNRILLISIASLFFFTGCSSNGLISSQKTSITIPSLNNTHEIANFNERQMISLGVAGEITENCHREGFTSFEEYKDIMRVYTDIIGSIDDYSAFSAGSKAVRNSSIKLNNKICRTEIPNILVYARDYYNNDSKTDIPNVLGYMKNKITVTDVINGLNVLGQIVQSHGEMMLEASNNLHLPPVNMNNATKGINSKRTRTINSYQEGDTTYFSNGTSARRNGNTVYHSDGSSSRISGNHIYHSDGSKTTISGKHAYHSDGSSCFMSLNGTLTCD